MRRPELNACRSLFPEAPPKEAESRKRVNLVSEVRAGKLQPVPTHRAGSPAVPRRTPSLSVPRQHDEGAGPLWQSFPQPPRPWVQVTGATGALRPLGALHGS